MLSPPHYGGTLFTHYYVLKLGTVSNNLSTLFTVTRKGEEKEEREG